MVACLTVATLVLFTLLRTDLSLTDGEASVTYVGWIALETVGVVGLLPIG